VLVGGDGGDGGACEDKRAQSSVARLAQRFVSVRSVVSVISKVHDTASMGPGTGLGQLMGLTSAMTRRDRATARQWKAEDPATAIYGAVHLRPLTGPSGPLGICRTCGNAREERRK
jgi:hypothetical protein